MTEFEDKLLVSELYELYGQMLTKKQQELFELYYYEDCSIVEIAQMNDVTKNAIYNSLKKSIKQLSNFEEILKIKQKYEDNINLLKENNIDDSIINKIK